MLGWQRRRVIVVSAVILAMIMVVCLMAIWRYYAARASTSRCVRGAGKLDGDVGGGGCVLT
jgi:hypothetical protein